MKICTNLAKRYSFRFGIAFLRKTMDFRLAQRFFMKSFTWSRFRRRSSCVFEACSSVKSDFQGRFLEIVEKDGGKRVHQMISLLNLWMYLQGFEHSFEHLVEPESIQNVQRQRSNDPKKEEHIWNAEKFDQFSSILIICIKRILIIKFSIYEE